MNDERSLSVLLARDLDGQFEQLVRTFQDRLYAFALRLTRSPQEAEESTQDAFVRAYRALQGYSEERRTELQIRPWLYRIVLNVVRNRMRRPTVATVPIDTPAANGLAGSTAEEPEGAALRSESRRRLAALIGDLPERYASAVVLRHVHGLSYAEAAEVLEQPVGTTKSDVHRGLRLLREALQSESDSLLEVGRHS